MKSNQHHNTQNILSKVFFTGLTLLTLNYAAAQNKKAIYKNATYSTEERVENLLSLMTLEEKAGQISTPLGWKMYSKSKNKKATLSDLYKSEINNRHIGGLWGLLRADPWTQKTLETGLHPKEAAEITNEIQKYAIEKTRLGIPLLLEEESMHGHMAIGTTVFPTAIGQASTWNPDLIEQMAAAIALEVRVQGGNVGYGPILDMAREPRWSRVEETFGEDPFLIAELGKAVIAGFQGTTKEHLKDGKHVAATLKHFAAYGVSEGGHNGGAVHLGERDLLSNYLYPVKDAIDAGIISVMTAYSSVDGIPSTAHKKLLTNTLRNDWGFDGFVISDLYSIEGLYQSHHTVADLEGAAAAAMNAGVDADLGGEAFQQPLLNAIKSGQVSEERLNQAVRRILTIKFELGLFDNPYTSPKEAEKLVRSNPHVELAREVARQSITLLKNQNNLLPLDKNTKSIAVIGANAAMMYNQLGDYTAPQPEDNIVTVLEGIQQKIPHAKINYIKGTAVRDTTKTDITAAVKAAKNAEIAIVVLGGSSARDFKTTYQATGAANVSADTETSEISDMESGEGYDRATLNMMGKQLELLQAVVATGTPTVLVLIKGRPLLLNWPAENVAAIIDAWYPGQEGGNAIADVLFGDYTPGGKLPISVPKSVGQSPVYYNHWFPERRDYVETDAKPLYPFGFGLSYTTFQISKPTITVKEADTNTEITVTLQVQNTGKVTGDEVVQLYIQDVLSSVVTPVKQLRGFERVSLVPGASKTVTFTITPKHLALYNAAMQRVVEPGAFQLMIGTSSEAIQFEETIHITNQIQLQ